MSTRLKKSGKGKMNAVDILFLLLLLFTAMVFVGYGFFSDASFFSPASDGGEKKIQYVFIVESVEEILLTESGTLPIVEGDTFYCLDHKITLGVVSSMGERMAAKTPVGEKDGVLVYAEHPGRYNFEVSVAAETVEQDGTYYVNGHAVRIGDRFFFTTPYFTGTCRCIGIEEVS